MTIIPRRGTTPQITKTSTKRQNKVYTSHLQTPVLLSSLNAPSPSAALTLTSQRHGIICAAIDDVSAEKNRNHDARPQKID